MTERLQVGYLDPPSALMVWCGQCCKFHTHGISDHKPGDMTSREPHCYVEPRIGYDIYVSDIPFSEAKKQLKEATWIQVQAMRAFYAGLRKELTPAIERLRAQLPPVLNELPTTPDELMHKKKS